MEQVTEECNKFISTKGTQALDIEYKPTDLSVGKYFIPNALGHSEYEDVAARIIRMGQGEGKFVAPSYRAIAEQVIKEIKEEQERAYAQRVRCTECSTINIIGSAKKIIIGFLSKKEIVSPVEEEVTVTEEEKQLPFSVFHINPQSFPAEIKSMINDGYLNLVTMDDEDFLEPTEKLIEEILDSQKSK